MKFQVVVLFHVPQSSMSQFLCDFSAVYVSQRKFSKSDTQKLSASVFYVYIDVQMCKSTFSYIHLKHAPSMHRQ